MEGLPVDRETLVCTSTENPCACGLVMAQLGASLNAFVCWLSREQYHQHGRALLGVQLYLTDNLSIPKAGPFVRWRSTYWALQ